VPRSPWSAAERRLKSELSKSKTVGHISRSHRWTKRIEHPICHDLKSWISSSLGDGGYMVLNPSYSVNRPLPETTEPVLDETLIRLSQDSLPESALVRLPAAKVRGHWGVTMLPTGEVIGELIARTEEGQRRILNQLPSYYKPLPRHTERKRGNYYRLLGIGGRNYCHFLHEIVMPLARVVPHLPSDTRILVPEDIPTHLSEALDVLELGFERVPFPDDALWEFETLYFVNPRQSSPSVVPAHYEPFGDAIQQRYGPRPGTRGRRLFLSRRYDDHWRTTNEDEVARFLEGHHFETVAPGKMTFREQVETFSRAEMIVGTGAGLVNMAFSAPGTNILQFQDPGNFRDYFWFMAASLGHKYSYFCCDQVDNQGRVADLHVPMEKLEHAVSLVLLAE
jgi:Glycosyltransferase 61